MSERRLIYFADPMCSWCWGFSPTITRVVERYGEDMVIEPIMGGLRAGNTEVLDDKGKNYIRGHWEHVQKASGQPFDFTFFERDDFVYDTEPACRAVVTMRRLEPNRSMGFLARLHAAFYAEGRDISDPKILAELAAKMGIASNDFAEAFESAEAQAETHGDFAITHQARIRGFPTLIAGKDEGGLVAITSGYQTWEMIEQNIDSWLNDNA